MTTFNLTCQAVEATLPDYLDDTLEPWLRTSIEEHLAGCDRCASLASELRNLAREASALPPLVPEEDVWPRVAHRIGAPGIHPETPAEPAPLTPLEREVPLPAGESFVRASAPPPAIRREELPLVREERLVESESFVPVREPAGIVRERPPVLEREVPLPTIDSPSLITPLTAYRDAAPVPATPAAYPEASPRKRMWKPGSIGLAAAALVLVTAGTTFLLTVQWLGTAAAPNVASDARTGKLTSTRVAAAAPGIRARPRGREQSIPNALASPSHPQPPSPAPSEQVRGEDLRSTQLPAAHFSPRQSLSGKSTPALTRSPEDAVYDREIVALQRIVRRQKRDLDTATAEEIDKNLRSVDSAIGQIREAAQEDPENAMLDAQSSHALQMKVELLRRAAMMHSTT